MSEGEGWYLYFIKDNCFHLECFKVHGGVLYNTVNFPSLTKEAYPWKVLV